MICWHKYRPYVRDDVSKVMRVCRKCGKLQMKYETELVLGRLKIKGCIWFDIKISDSLLFKRS